jgi:AcrR family transcriptional regulator
MKSVHSSTRERTRRAILEATADVISATNGIGFSIQAVADQAGVTHRTVYNHFPTRDALCDAFYDYVDELMSSLGRPPDTTRLAAFPAAVDALYKGLEKHDRYARASVMLMIGNRRPMQAWRSRTAAFEKVVARETAGRAPLSSRQVAAAARLFLSSMGWHLLTEQCGLSTDEAAATASWATRTLLEAATSNQAATRPVKPASRTAHVARGRRR